MLYLFDVISNSMKTKAAFIPYYGNKILVCRSSDPAFGGPDFALCKGTVDPGESLKAAAIREAEEELGLIASNIGAVKHLANYTSSRYILAVYYAQVKNPEMFGPHDDEIAETRWMTREEFAKVGRSDHKQIVERFFVRIS